MTLIKQQSFPSQFYHNYDIFIYRKTTLSEISDKNITKQENKKIKSL